MQIRKDLVNLLEADQLLLLEQLSVVIGNTLALATVAIDSDIANYKLRTIHEYFGAIDTLQQKAQELLQRIIRTHYQRLTIQKEVILTESDKDTVLQ